MLIRPEPVAPAPVEEPKPTPKKKKAPKKEIIVQDLTPEKPAVISAEKTIAISPLAKPLQSPSFKVVSPQKQFQYSSPRVESESVQSPVQNNTMPPGLGQPKPAQRKKNQDAAVVMPSATGLPNGGVQFGSFKQETEKEPR